MKFDDVNTEIVSEIKWGNKRDPTEYDYGSETIRIREDYYRQMRRSNPLSHHWLIHETAHHIFSKCYRKLNIPVNLDNYPNNQAERFAFSYQFYYLMENRSCSTINELYFNDQFFRHKKIYHPTLEYYWNNSNFIISEFKEKTKCII